MILPEELVYLRSAFKVAAQRQPRDDLFERAEVPHDDALDAEELPGDSRDATHDTIADVWPIAAEI